MQILIVRTPIFDQYVLPALKQQATQERCSLEDYIRALLYSAYKYIPAPQTTAQRQGCRAAEQALTKISEIPCLVVEVDCDFYHRFGINTQMNTVNKILYEAAGCGQLCK
jgi:hypothetical protein